MSFCVIYENRLQVHVKLFYRIVSYNSGCHNQTDLALTI